jgi:ribonuclease D
MPIWSPPRPGWRDCDSRDRLDLEPVRPAADAGHRVTHLAAKHGRDHEIGGMPTAAPQPTPTASARDPSPAASSAAETASLLCQARLSWRPKGRWHTRGTTPSTTPAAATHSLWPRLPPASGSLAEARVVWDAAGHDGAATVDVRVSSDVLVRVLRGDLPGDLADAFARSRRIAWDIETTGLDWRQERIGTCQLFSQTVGVAVVSVGQDRPAALASLLEDSTVEKIFHHAPFDLRFMVSAWQVSPATVRCTKVASKILEPTAPNETHSLQRLVGRYLGVSLPKGAVRVSNWSAAELTDEQIRYATGDVVHLPRLLDAMESALRDGGHEDLYDACCTFLPARVMLELGGYPDVFAY